MDDAHNDDLMLIRHLYPVSDRRMSKEKQEKSSSCFFCEDKHERIPTQILMKMQKTTDNTLTAAVQNIQQNIAEWFIIPLCDERSPLNL